MIFNPRMINLSLPVRFLRGHQVAMDAQVNSLAVTPDGSHLISGAGDNVVNIWNLCYPKAENILNGHSKRIIRVAITKDEKLAYSASEDAVIKLWDIEGGCQIDNIILQKKGKPGLIDSIAINPDRNLAVSMSESSTIWDIERKMPLEVLPDMIGGRGYSWNINGYVGGENNVDISKDGTEVVTAFYSDNRPITKVWDLVNNVELRHFQGGGEENNSPPLAVVPRTKNMVLLGKGGNLKEIDISTDKPIRNLGKCQADLLLVHSNGKLVVSAREDLIQIWGTDDSNKSYTLGIHKPRVKRMVMSSDGRHVVTESSEGTVIIWDLDGGKNIGLPKSENPILLDAGFNDVQHVALVKNDSIRILEVENFREVCKVHLLNIANSISITPDNRYVFFGLENGEIKIRDNENGTERIHEVHGKVVFTVAPYNNYVFFGLENGVISLWNIKANVEELALRRSDIPMGIGLIEDGFVGVEER